MAQVPTVKEAERLKKISETEEANKKRSQARQGKEFVNNGQGVIPEAVWRRIKRSNQ